MYSFIFYLSGLGGWGWGIEKDTVCVYKFLIQTYQQANFYEYMPPIDGLLEFLLCTFVTNLITICIRLFFGIQNKSLLLVADSF